MIQRINSDDADSTIMYNAAKSGRNKVRMEPLLEEF
jgi:hypothetical protein